VLLFIDVIMWMDCRIKLGLSFDEIVMNQTNCIAEQVSFEFLDLRNSGFQIKVMHEIICPCIFLMLHNIETNSENSSQLTFQQFQRYLAPYSSQRFIEVT
jgi:hypothetical protein